MSMSNHQISIVFVILGNFDFELWVEQKGHVPVVLGPCVQCCPCEASEQKWGQKLKYIPKEIEL